MDYIKTKLTTNLVNFEISMTILRTIKAIISSIKRDVKYIARFKYSCGLLGQNYRVATLSTLYLIISGINIRSLKLIGKC